MAAGLASVVSDIPASTQLIQREVTGLIAPLRDSGALAQSISRLLSAPEERARMGLAAREFVVNDYSLETVATRYETLFSEACGEQTR